MHQTVPVFYVINQIKAKKKILWLHGDMETNAGDEMLAIKYHSCFDQVFAVSKSVYDSFLKYHPDMEKKTDIFYNFVDVDGIKKKAKQGHLFKTTMILYSKHCLLADLINKKDLILR